MKLSDSAVTTAEVKEWKGLHLLHFAGSSCSQKVRILLGEKQLAYVSHHVDLVRNAHVTPWFLGINPRGVVPVLVHDGEVHVESNDILEYLDALPSPVAPFMPHTDAERAIVKASLDHEDGLHMDMRNLTMGFILPRRLIRKSEETLQRWEREGATDPKRVLEVKWWRDFARQGVPADTARGSFKAFAAAFEELNQTLAKQDWLIGGRISVLDVAWFIAVHRLGLAGYPVDRHAHVKAWYQRLASRPAFAKEIQVPAALAAITAVYAGYRRLRGTSLHAIAS
jgi:ganglioside-induced differentiation-associated protein 1